MSTIFIRIKKIQKLINMNIKKVPVVFALIICLAWMNIIHSQTSSFKLSVTLEGVTEQNKIYLQHKYNEIVYTDSAVFRDGKASFKGKTTEPNMYWLSLSLGAGAAPELIFFIDGGKIIINGRKNELGAAQIKAGKTQNEYIEYQRITQQFKEEKNQFIIRFQRCSAEGNRACAEQIIDSAKLNEKNYIQQLIGFIKKNPKSNVGGYLIFSSVFDWPEIADYDMMYAALDKKVKEGKFGKLALNKINSIKGTTIGYPALDFAQADKDGVPITLSSYKGKYVLVDFWASWCGPCRRENPNVVNAYKKYKAKGFDILGVSLDENKEKWLQAVAKDGLDWQQVCDLKGWGNEAGKLYGVTSIPFNLLLDKEGKIIAKGLRGADLDAKLAEIFGE
jgi:thiol-disulfide isomerase/thioredoxin